MQKAIDVNTGHNYCKCGCYLYRDEDSKIIFAKNVRVIYSKYSHKFVCTCPKCYTTNFVCKD